MDNKTLSVIIPNHNKSVYIRDAIDSILEQTRLPNEIILVDDASRDISKQIIKEYALKYPSLIRAFYFEENQGVQKARNYGAEKATSEYITFLDSDDFYYDRFKIENEMEHASKHRIVYSSYCFFDNETKEFFCPPYSLRCDLFYKRNPLYCYVRFRYMQYWPFAFIASKNAFASIGGYDFPINYYEDLDLLIRYSKFGIKLKRISGYGLAIRRNANDVDHLSRRNDLKSTAKEVIASRYRKTVSKRSVIDSFFFDVFGRVLAAIKRRGNRP